MQRMQKMHRWPAALRLLALGAAAAVSGCVQVTSGPGANGVGVVSASGVRWAWSGTNLLRRPALFFERIEHLPPPADRVRHFRWLHGAGADDPLLRYPVVTSYPTVVTEPVIESAASSPAELVPEKTPPDPVPVPLPMLLPYDRYDAPGPPAAPPSDGTFDGPTASADLVDPIRPAGT